MRWEFFWSLKEKYPLYFDEEKSTFFRKTNNFDRDQIGKK
jgi:hypothetical protein